MISFAANRSPTTFGRFGGALFLGMLGASVLMMGARREGAPNRTAAPVTVSLPDTTGGAGETMTVPVEVEGLVEQSIFSVEFTIRYDDAVISVIGLDASQTMAADLRTVVNTDSAGAVTVSAAAADEFPETGRLIHLKVRCKTEGTSPLTWTRFQFNEGRPRADLRGGTITVESP